MKTAQRRALKLLLALVFVGFGLFSLGGAVFGAGEDYPVKSVNLISGYAPGGSAGNSAMIFAEAVKIDTQTVTLARR